MYYVGLVITTVDVLIALAITAGSEGAAKKTKRSD